MTSTLKENTELLEFPTKDDAVYTWNSIFIFLNIKNMLMKRKKKKKSFKSN